MKSRRIPVADVDKRKRGDCRLCRRRTYLTRTHIPAKSAGNVGTAQPPVVEIGEDGKETYGLGSEQLGGIRDYWFCADCNNRTGRWDEAFVAWTYAPLAALHDPSSRGNTFSAKIIDADTGAFVRCLWAWMFAISDASLSARLPDVAAAAKSGDPVFAPADPRLFLAVTRDDRIAIQALNNSVIVTAPPFVAMLLSRRALEFGGDDGFFDLAPWLMHPAGMRRTVEITMPVVVPGPLPMIGEPVVD
jgi:hypothetical protein